MGIISDDSFYKTGNYSNYEELVDALEEFREARDEQLPNYDPHDYSKKDQDERREKAVAKLDSVFGDILDALLVRKFSK